MDFTSQLLNERTKTHGIPGHETPIGEVMRKYLNLLGVLSQDETGSAICEKNNTLKAPRVMPARQMDLIGFMVERITKEGFISLLPESQLFRPEAKCLI